MSDTGSFDLNNAKKQENLTNENILITVNNGSQKEVAGGSVTVKNTSSQDTQKSTFGYLAPGNREQKNVLLNGLANMIEVHISANDGTGWDGYNSSVDGLPSVTVNLH